MTDESDPYDGISPDLANVIGYIPARRVPAVEPAEPSTAVLLMRAFQAGEMALPTPQNDRKGVETGR